VNTRDTAGTGSGILRCAKVHYRTRTRSTRFGNTAGIPVPVRNPKSVQPYILLVMQELQEEYNFGSDLRVPPDPRKTFIHNPCEDTYFKSRQAANHDVLSNDGQSYWSDVLNDPWQFLEMR